METQTILGNPYFGGQKKGVLLDQKKNGSIFFGNNIVSFSVNMLGNILTFKQGPWGTFFVPTHVH